MIISSHTKIISPFGSGHNSGISRKSGGWCITKSRLRRSIMQMTRGHHLANDGITHVCIVHEYMYFKSVHIRCTCFRHQSAQIMAIISEWSRLEVDRTKFGFLHSADHLKKWSNFAHRLQNIWFALPVVKVTAYWVYGHCLVGTSWSVGYLAYQYLVRF